MSAAASSISIRHGQRSVRGGGKSESKSLPENRKEIFRFSTSFQSRSIEGACRWRCIEQTGVPAHGAISQSALEWGRAPTPLQGLTKTMQGRVKHGKHMLQFSIRHALQQHMLHISTWHKSSTALQKFSEHQSDTQCQTAVRWSLATVKSEERAKEAEKTRFVGNVVCIVRKWKECIPQVLSYKCFSIMNFSNISQKVGAQVNTWIHQERSGTDLNWWIHLSPGGMVIIRPISLLFSSLHFIIMQMWQK